MNRGNARQAVFRSQDNYEAFIKLLEESIGLWNIRVHAFSLLPNHYHLLIETPLANLARVMRHINGVYTQWFNHRWKREGHLFRGRYKAILVEEDAYLVELVRYIHLNPVEAKLVRKPEEHPWSSHRCYLGGKPWDWLTTDRILSYFGKRLNKGRRKFHDFVMDGVPEKLAAQFAGNQWPAVYCSDHFQDWVEWNFVKEIRDRELQYKLPAVLAIKEDRLQKILSSVLGMEWEVICQGRGQIAKRNRMLAIRCYRHYLHYPYEGLSKIFGGIHPSRISHAVKMDLAKQRVTWAHLQAEIQNAKRKT